MLLGRSRELEEIERLLADASAGAGRALLVTGEAGIGKTTLLDAARERAEGLVVVDAIGIEAEATLPFAALGEISSPFLDRLGELPAPQSEALEAALALGPGPPGDRLAACAGFLGLLRLASRHQPILLVVDDVHWLDSASAQCLGYAARRLDDLHVVMLAAARGEVPNALGEAAGQLPIGGLDREPAISLLRAQDSELAPDAMEALLGLAVGNPLALRELPSLLSDEQRRGLAPIEPVPVPNHGLGAAFARRLDELGPEPRAALLVAAASLDRHLVPVVAACGDLGIDPGALERAESAGVISLGQRDLAFAHPLLRAVAYQRGDAKDRRRAHAALSAHTRDDARAWHLAAAAVGADDGAAEALESAAARATGRGAHGAAADAFERAAELSGEDGPRAIRAFSAGLAAAMGGDFERGAALLEPIAEDERSEMRSTARHLLVLVTLTGGIRGALDNHAMLIDEAERTLPRDPDLAAAMFADAGVCACVAGDCRLALAAGERAAAAITERASATTRCQAISMMGMGLALAGRTEDARQALDRAGELLPEVDPLSPAAQSISFALHGRVCTGQHQQLREEAVALGEAAREARTVGLFPYYELVAADSAYRTGDWKAAGREIAESVATAEESSQRGPLSVALTIKARLHAALGETEAARSDAARGIALAEPNGYGSTVLWAHSALGFLELGLGRIAEAIAELEQAAVLNQLAGLEDPTVVPWAPDLVEALVQAGRDADARRVCAEFESRAERSGGALGLALAGRCRGLTEEKEFERDFEDALAAHERAIAPLERARTLLAFGARLHRARRRVDARERLREAEQIFQSLGARPWSERCAAELRAAGAIRRKPSSDPDELSAQEMRIALAVARGATNREVASELYLSPKTIEFHLGRVYRKLDINSRTQLATLVSEGRLDQPLAVGEAPKRP